MKSKITRIAGSLEKRYMTKLVLSITFVAPLFIYSANVGGQQTATWIQKEFSDPSGVPAQAVESYINDQCQPSGLDGIQLLAVQKGPGEAQHLHVYCRRDNASSTHYKVTLAAIKNRKVDGAVTPVLERTNVRIGPFFFGKEGEDDGFLLVEKTR